MQGMCFAMWIDPAKVPDVAEDVMSDAGYTFPLLLANRVRAQCCDRMGRRFDAIMKRIPQVIILSLHLYHTHHFPLPAIGRNILLMLITPTLQPVCKT